MQRTVDQTKSAAARRPSTFQLGWEFRFSKVTFLDRLLIEQLNRLLTHQHHPPGWSEWNTKTRRAHRVRRAWIRFQWLNPMIWVSTGATAKGSLKSRNRDSEKHTRISRRTEWTELVTEHRRRSWIRKTLERNKRPSPSLPADTRTVPQQFEWAIDRNSNLPKWRKICIGSPRLTSWTARNWCSCLSDLASTTDWRMWRKPVTKRNMRTAATMSAITMNESSFCVSHPIGLRNSPISLNTRRITISNTIFYCLHIELFWDRGSAMKSNTILRRKN